MMMSKGYDNDNTYIKKMKLINYIIEAPDSLSAEQLLAYAYNNDLSYYILREDGYIDLFNENNYSLISIVDVGKYQVSSLKIVPEIVNTNI